MWVEWIWQLAALEFLSAFDLGFEPPQYSRQLLQVRGVRRRHHIDILGRPNVAVVADGYPADDQEVDAFPGKLSEESPDVEVRQRAYGGRPPPLQP